MDEFYNKHYIITDVEGRILAAWSDGPHPERDSTNARCINERGGYQLTLSGEENPPLFTVEGIFRFRWDGEKVVLRTEEELEEDRKALPLSPPTEGEQLRADIDFLMALNGMFPGGGGLLD